MNVMPLLPEIGGALAVYLNKERGDSTCWRVFLRMWGCGRDCPYDRAAPRADPDVRS